MLLITGITAQDRRDSVRELADVSTKSYDDTSLDRKIENADAIAQALLQQTTPDNNMLSISNIQSAILIRIGIGGTENEGAVQELRETSKRIIQSINAQAPEQGAEYTGITSSILDKEDGDDF